MGRLRFYATIESRYGANRFTVTVRKRNGNFSMTPTVNNACTFKSPRMLFSKSLHALSISMSVDLRPRFYSLQRL